MSMFLFILSVLTIIGLIGGISYNLYKTYQDQFDSPIYVLGILAYLFVGVAPVLLAHHCFVYSFGEIKSTDYHDINEFIKEAPEYKYVVEQEFDNGYITFEEYDENIKPKMIQNDLRKTLETAPELLEK